MTARRGNFASRSQTARPRSHRRGRHARLAFGAARDVATTNIQAWWEVLQEAVDDVQRVGEEVLSACYQLGLELGMSWIVRGYLLIETADGQIVGPWVEWQRPGQRRWSNP